MQVEGKRKLAQFGLGTDLVLLTEMKSPEVLTQFIIVPRSEEM